MSKQNHTDVCVGAETEILNRREFVKKAMGPAETAKKELIRSTATDEVRLQGTQETGAPSLKPYTESVDVSDRGELSRLIGKARMAGKSWRVGRSMKEGYRYTLTTRWLREDDEADDAEDVESQLEVAPTPELPEEEEGDKPTACEILAKYLSIHGNDDNSLTLAAKAADAGDGGEAPHITIAGLTDEEYETLRAEFEKDAKEGEDESPEEALPEEDPQEIDETSSAEKKAGRKDVVKDFTGGRKERQAIDAAERKFRSMGKVGMTDEGLEGGDRRFIKTSNSPIDSVDLIDELMARGVGAQAADDGVTVSADDYDFALDTLMEMESDYYSHESALDEGKDDKLGVAAEATVSDDLEIRLDDLSHFRPSAGARETWAAILEAGKLGELADALKDFAKDGKMTTTDLNDLLWFEREWVYDTLGIKPLRVKGGDDVVDAEEGSGK